MSQLQATRIKIGVLGAANPVLDPEGLRSVENAAKKLGKKIADSGSVLCTGDLDGVPGMVVASHRSAGGFAIGFSPAQSAAEQAERFYVPVTKSDAVVYTGFGYKGRNLLLVRSSDIVIVINGGVGTLNEFTIAFDEGKVIGLLKGSGGAAAEIPQILTKLPLRATGAVIVEEIDPDRLVARCLEEYQRRGI
jgi:uncharacterized protein (TIGR00725 family)